MTTFLLYLLNKQPVNIEFHTLRSFAGYYSYDVLGLIGL